MCHPEVPEGAVAPEVQQRELAIATASGDSIPALLASPDAPARGGVVVVADIYGRSPFYEELGARLATAGFHAIVPDLFFRLGALPERTFEVAAARRAKLDDATALRDLSAVVDHMRARAGAKVVGTVGFCMGGTLVLQLAGKVRDVATVCYYGFPGPGSNRVSTVPRPLEMADRIAGPILGFWGDQDAAVGMDNVQQFAGAMRERGVAFDHTIYPGLGHGFMAASRLDPSHEAYEAACESWTRTLEFYRAHLGS